MANVSHLEDGKTTFVAALGPVLDYTIVPTVGTGEAGATKLPRTLA